MSDKHFIYQGKDEDTNFLIYFRDNQNTGRRQYHLLEEIPSKYLKTEEQFEKFKKFVSRYNQEHNKRARIVKIKDDNGKPHLFLDEPCLAVEVIQHIMKTQKDILPVFEALGNISHENRAIREEEARRAEIARRREIQRRELEGTDVSNGVLVSQNKYKKPSKGQQIFGKAVAAGLAVLMLISLAAVVNGQKGDNGTVSTPPGIVSTETPNSTGHGRVEHTIGASTSASPIAPETPMEPQDKPYIDYDLLTFETYKNSAGQSMYEVSSALEISYACYNNIIRELKEYNEKSPDHLDYSFDYTKFVASMFTGEQIRESSLREYVAKGGNIKNSPDYDDLCRGSHKLGPDAIKEANEVSRRLTGEDVIRSEEDLYDLVRATRACMYIAIKNYEYCAGVIPADSVSPNMVFDAYLWGCGNVRKWLRECVDDGEYKPKDYSVDILYYGECLEEYWEKILAGITDGSHDKHWQDLHVNGLWKVDEYKEALKGTEPGA